MPEFGQLEMAATESITLEPGVSINPGSYFIARVNPQLCNMYGYNSMLFGNNDGNFNEGQIVSPSDEVQSTYQEGESVRANDLLNEVEVEVFPNPASNKIFVRSSDLSSFSLSLYSSVGSLCHRVDYFSNAIELDVAYLPRGLYTLVVRNVMSQEVYQVRTILE